MAIEIKQGATTKLRMSITDANGATVDPSTYHHIEIYLIDSFTFETVAKYTTDYDSTTTEYKEAEIVGNNVDFYIDSSDTIGVEGNVDIQPNLYTTDANYEDGYKVEKGSAVCLKVNKAK